MQTNIVWLRNDLRIRDNTALYAACKNKNAIIFGIFIATPEQWKIHRMSPRQAWFIRDNLKLLAKSFFSLGIELSYIQCKDFSDQIDILVRFLNHKKGNHLFYNYQYEINERERDLEVERLLSPKIICHGFNDSVLLPPGIVQTRNKSMFKVFTPFRHAFLKKLINYKPICLPIPFPRKKTEKKLSVIEPFDYPCIDTNEMYPVGELAGLSRLKLFFKKKIKDYKYNRDIPSINGTSQISAYLAIGALSPRQCYKELLGFYPNILNDKNENACNWLNELIWRDFYRHLLISYPKLCKNQSFVIWERYISWRKDDDLFKSWCEGRTGFPIVDAAMRQMVSTGWMHNRLRMITASFLTKDLLIDWRRGESFFMSNLIDGDLASNNGGWQWAASTGTDAVPYFRVFNPVTQGKRFDPNGKFIRKWVPELSTVSIKQIHHPFQNLMSEKKELNYPLPIVEHTKARIRAIMHYKAAKDYAIKMSTNNLKNN